LAGELSVAERVRLAQSGDLHAFEQLFQQYHRGIYNTIFQLVRNETDATDLTQDVFVRAFRALPRLQSPEAFTSWLYRIAVNLGRNHLRDAARARTESLELGAGDEEDVGGQREIADSTGNPEVLALSKEMSRRVRQAIGTLSEDHRTVIALHHLEGMSVEEIARIMECSVGTVKSRLSRARDHLRRKLAAYVEEG
jgi:RNA polymerase sigma-70 factor (ECF subfamily)